MKSIRKLIFCSVISLVSIFCCNVNAEVKEDASLFTDDVYIIGSTRFEVDYVITASRAAIAGADEAYVQQNVYNNFEFRGSDIKTFYYCALDDSWSEVMENGSGLKELSEKEVSQLTSNLNIFYVNNVEKKIEVTYDETIDEGSVNSNLSGKAIVSGNKITVPATWINGFTFTSNGENVEVELAKVDSSGEVLELEKPIIKKSATINITIPDKIYVGKPFEFTISVEGNSYEGKEDLSGYSQIDYYGQVLQNSPVESIERFDESSQTWVSGGIYLGDKIETKTYKFRAVVNYEGTYAFNIYRGVEGGFVSLKKEFKADVDPNAVAVVNNKYYSDITDAINSASDYSTVKLLKDINVDGRIKVSKNMTLDLNKKTINLLNELDRVQVEDASLTIKNGVVLGVSYALDARGNATLNVESDLYIKLDDESVTKDKYGIVLWDNAIVNFNGNILIKGSGSEIYGISGNGSLKANNPNTTLNINGGVITSSGAAIYQPQKSVTTIKGGILTANTVIGIKSGKLNITGGKLIANGESVSPKTDGDGFSYTGDTIFIEDNANYQGGVTVNITGGNLESTNGYIIQEYNPTLGTNKECNATVTGIYSVKDIISSNTFSYIDGQAYFESNGVYYTKSSLAKLLQNENINKGYVTLLSDISVEGGINISSNVTLDLGGNTLNTKTILFQIPKDMVVNIKNGTITKIDNDGTGVIQIVDNGELNILDDLTINAKEYGINVYDTAVLNYYGNMVLTGEGYAISGSASKSDNLNPNTTVNIYNGTIEALDGAAIYQPQTGTLNITGGTLKANTVIGIKAGTINMTDGSLIATGEKVEPKTDNNGFEYTGDTIFIEENTNYNDNIVIDITGGKLESTNGYLIQEYNPTIGTNNELSATITGIYSVKNETSNSKIFYYTKSN